LKDIQAKLQTVNYNRFRFGISDAFSKGRQVDYVLGDWNEEETSKLPERLEKSSEVILSFGMAGITNTMNEFNGNYTREAIKLPFFIINYVMLLNNNLFCDLSSTIINID